MAQAVRSINKHASTAAALAAYIVVLGALSFIGGGAPSIVHTAHADSMALTGYAWSDNIGWISFSGTAANSSPYSVGVNNDGTLSGYAWSDNIGWINFGATTCGTQASMTNGALSGWAQAVSNYAGWDGCIKLADAVAPAYGPTLTGSDLNGFAWGSDPVGWISFNCLTGGSPSTLQTLTYTSGTNSWTAPAGVTSVNYLVVAGGGGGGYANDRTSGGGGAGGVLTGTLSVTPGTTYTATVGAGGVGASNGVNPTQGGSSSFGSITATGGGTGGFYGATCWSGGNGGSGGGSYHNGCSAPGSGITGQGRYAGIGYDGGNGTNGTFTAGGGGGAVGFGANGAAGSGGAGGAGLTSSISGSSVTYGGGGGGGCQRLGTGSCAGGAGGAGGGGAGGTGVNSTPGSGTAGTANRGGGGGGGGSGGVGGAGGSGIVIISYTPVQNICSISNYKVTYGGPTAAPTCTLAAAPNPASTNSPITLNYTTTNTPTTGTIVGPSGTITTAATSSSGFVSATAPGTAGNYTYTMTVSNPLGSATCQASLTAQLDVCTDIVGLQSSVPSGCTGPTPPPVGSCLPAGYIYNGTSCTATGPAISGFSGPTRVRKGSTATLTYTVTNPPASCTITGNNGYDSGPLTPTSGVAGQVTTNAIDASTRFTMTCGSATASVTVGVIPVFQEQ